MNLKWRSGLLAVLVIVAGSITAAGPQDQRADDAAMALQRAARTELVDGDLPAAIEQYTALVARFQGERAVVAQALVRLGACYQKLGDQQARATFERVVRDFGDQADAAAEARERLAAMAAPGNPSAAANGDGDASAAVTVLSASDPNLFGDDFMHIALSPDGRRVAYQRMSDNNGVPTVLVRDLSSGETTRLTNHGVTWVRQPDGGWRFDRPGHGWINALAWSRDGRRIAFTAPSETNAGSTLWIVDVGQGEATPVAATDTLQLRVSDWAPSGDTLLCRMRRADQTNSLVTVDLDSGEVVPLISRGWDDGSAAFSPDGRFVAFSMVEDEISSVYLMAADGTSRRRVTGTDVDAGGPLWSPDGSTIVYQAAGDTWAIAVDDGTPRGTARRLRDGPTGQMLGAPYGRVVNWTAEAGYSYVDNNAAVTAYRVGVDPESGEGTGVVEPLEGVSESAQWFTWSPDMSRIAFTDWVDAGSVTIYSAASRSVREFSVKPARNTARIWWSADGRQVLAEPWASTNKTVIAVDVEDGAVESLFPPLHEAGRLHLSPDGSKLLYLKGSNEALRSLVIRDLETGDERVLAPERESDGRFSGYVRPAFSPDGRDVLFGRQFYDGVWRSSVWVISIDGTGLRRVAGFDGTPSRARIMRYAIWGPDSGRIAYSDGNELFVTDVSDGRTSRLQTPAEWNQVDVHDWSHDGRWIGVRGGKYAVPELWVVPDILGDGGAGASR